MARGVRVAGDAEKRAVVAGSASLARLGERASGCFGGRGGARHLSDEGRVDVKCLKDK